jgi:hypothetical protein
MTRTLRFAIGLALVALTARDATAQWNAARLDGNPNRVYSTLGIDPAVLPTVGYARIVRLFGHPFQLAGDVGVVAAEWDTRDFRARLDAFTSLLRWRSLHLTGSAAFITRGTSNSIYDGLNFGADFTGALGVHRHRWFAAGEFGFDKAVITHITHSEWYRQYFYPEAKDGWYLTGGGTFHYGLAAGVTLGPTELVARYGWRRTERFGELTPPMYASLGIGLGF